MEESVRYEECLRSLGSSASGLTLDEAHNRYERYGPNRLTVKKKRSPLLVFLKQFKSPLIYILIAAAVFSLLLEIEGFLIERSGPSFKQPGLDAAIIIATVLANAVVGFAQEWKAERAIESVKSLIQEKARVIRSGEELEIQAEELVPGDVLLLKAGERVPGDARVLYERNLHVDESLLTGESIPVHKTVGCQVESPHYYEESNKVLAGSYVTEGRGRAVVLDTGNNTVLGNISHKLTTIQKEESPLTKRTRKLSLFFLAFSIAFLLLVFLLGFFRGLEVTQIVLLSVSVLVSSIPEGLPAVITVVLSIGVYRLSKKNVIVRNLSIVESLGLANVICTDKTGTLTMNQMTVRKVFTVRHSYEVSLLTGGSKVGKVHLAGPGHSEAPIVVDGHSAGSASSKDYPDLELLLVGMSLCNDAEVYHECPPGESCRGASLAAAGSRKTKGSPTEAALLVAAESTGINKELLEEAWPRISEIPFSSDRKFMATLHRSSGFSPTGAPSGLDTSRSIIVAKGAPEVLEAFLEAPSETQEIEKEYASQGLRVLACAIKQVPSDTYSLEAKDLKGMIFLGLCGINDPPREGVADYVRACDRAGISVIMITGDSEFTAKAIGREVGIYRPERGDLAFTGDDLDKMDDTSLQELAVTKAKVFSRTDPIHKLRIVNALLSGGAIAAMTGDGVNDSPALRQASVGVAMGITGTDIAKEAADIILQEERFEAIVEGVDEGRNILASMRRVVQFYLTTSFAQNLLIVAALALFATAILSPIQILWVNLAATGLTDIGLAMEPKERGLLERPPSSLKESVISREVLSLSLFHGFVMVGVTLTVYLMYVVNEPARAATVTFLVFIVLQWFHSLNCRSQTKSVVELGVLRNRALLAFLMVSLSLVIVLLVLPPLSTAFAVEPLGLIDWLVIVAAGASIFVVDEIRKFSTRVLRKHHRVARS